MGCVSRCPGLTTTPGPGPWTDPANCSVCAPDACNGHGTCSVSGFQVTCACDQLYRLSPSCSEPVVLIIVVATVGGSLLLCGMALLWKHFGRTLGKVRFRAELNEHLLETTQKNLEKLKEVWHINASDVALERALDAGSYGEVWLGEWGAMKVSVACVLIQLLRRKLGVSLHRLRAEDVCSQVLLTCFRWR